MIARTLSEFLENPNIYTELHLTNKNIHDVDCEAIATALPRARLLKHINLDCNFISSEGALKIATTAATIPTIEFISFDFNEIDPTKILEIQTILGERCSLSPEEESSPEPAKHHPAFFLRIDTNVERDIHGNESGEYTDLSPDWLKEADEVNPTGESTHIDDV
jgi:hypothetical protein